MYLPCIYQVFSRKSCSWCRNRWTNTWSWWSWSIWVPPRSRHSSGCCRRSRSRWGEGWRGRHKWGRPWWRRSHWECPWHQSVVQCSGPGLLVQYWHCNSTYFRLDFRLTLNIWHWTVSSISNSFTSSIVSSPGIFNIYSDNAWLQN